MADGIVEVLLMPDGEKRRALMNGFEVLTEKAAKNQWIYDELMQAADDLTTGDHWRLTPDWLRRFAADARSGRLPRPTRRGPREDERRLFRDVEIGLTVDIVQRHFCVHVYSGSKTIGTTSASIVAKALRLERQKISENTVIKAWKRAKR